MATLDKKLFQLSAVEVIDAIKSGQLTVVEYLESIIERIEKINSTTNAWVHLNHKQSLEIAKKFDKKMKNGENIGPLYGVPIGIKDIFNTIDFPTEMGSLLWKNFTPGNDARVVHYLRMANAIIVGKTETAEFAVHALGKSKNPYDPTRSPGTSSSGSAIAVATSMVPLALGTQTAGSIIRPASYCGVYGFKPSFGLVPRTGMLKTTDTLDQIGYFARTPQDLALLFDIIRVKGKHYPLSESAFNDKDRQTVHNRPWKIKFVKTHVWDQAEEYAKKHLEHFVDKISEHDEFQVDHYDMPDDFALAHIKHEIIYAKSLAYYFKKELQNKTLVSDVFYELASQADKISMSEFDSAIEYQTKIRRILDELFCSFDIIISLSTAGHAPLRDKKENDDPSLIWTMCGNPTINIPTIKTENGLPMGVQVVARRFNDILLLNFVNLLHKQNLITNSHTITISS